MIWSSAALAATPSSYAAIDTEQIQWEPLDAAQRELLVFALACDQTRVFTYRFSPCNDYTVYPGFWGGVETPGATADGVVYYQVENLPTPYNARSVLSVLKPAMHSTAVPVRWVLRLAGTCML